MKALTRLKEEKGKKMMEWAEQVTVRFTGEVR